MNDEWINTCKTEFYKWLSDAACVTQDAQTGWYSLTTPFVGLFNDNIEIYVKRDNGRIILSDDGQTLDNLELAGAHVVRSPKRKEWIDMVLLNYGISLNGNELWAEGKETEFNQKKFNMLCAITEISDMAMMAKHTVASAFRDDIREFLDERKIIYTPQFIARGKSGLDIIFDFQIAGLQKELVIKAFNSLSTTSVFTFLYGWEDIKDARKIASGKELRGLAIVNDIEKELKDKYIYALENKGADVIKWNNRHTPKVAEILAA